MKLQILCMFLTVCFLIKFVLVQGSTQYFVTGYIWRLQVCDTRTIPQLQDFCSDVRHCLFHIAAATVHTPVCKDNHPSINIWRYSPFRALASLIRRIHSSLFSAFKPVRGISEAFWTRILFRGGVVTLTPNLQPGERGCRFLSGSSPLTCSAWVTLPVAMLPPA